MFENVTAGWKLGGAIRKLVFEDMALMAYPIISGIVLILETIAIFASLIFFTGSSSAAFWLGLFLYYVVVYFTSAFMLVSMLIAFKSFIRGKKIGLGEAFSQASSYAFVILEWSLFEAVITMIIRAIEGRLRGIGAIIFGLGVSMALSAAQAFAIPVIVEKRTGPVSTLKESTGFILKNYGKTFGGILFSDLYSMLFSIAGIALGVIGFIAAYASFILFVALGVIGTLLLVFGVMLNYLLSNTYKLLLYETANGAPMPKGITKELLSSGIR